MSYFSRSWKKKKARGRENKGSKKSGENKIFASKKKESRFTVSLS